MKLLNQGSPVFPTAEYNRGKRRKLKVKTESFPGKWLSVVPDQSHAEKARSVSPDFPTRDAKKKKMRWNLRINTQYQITVSPALSLAPILYPTGNNVLSKYNI